MFSKLSTGDVLLTFTDGRDDMYRFVKMNISSYKLERLNQETKKWERSQPTSEIILTGLLDAIDRGTVVIHEKNSKNQTGEKP